MDAIFKRNDFQRNYESHILTLHQEFLKSISPGDDFSFMEEECFPDYYKIGKCIETLLFGHLNFNKVSYWVKDAYYSRDVNINKLKSIHIPRNSLCLKIDSSKDFILNW